VVFELNLGNLEVKQVVSGFDCDRMFGKIGDVRILGEDEIRDFLS
jgi:hypothetical protein